MHSHSYENEFNFNEIFSYERLGAKTRFEKEAKGNSQILYFHKFHNTPLFTPRKICIGIVLDFSWHIFTSREKLQTDYAKFWGVKEVNYGICASIYWHINKVSFLKMFVLATLFGLRSSERFCAF